MAYPLSQRILQNGPAPEFQTLAQQEGQTGPMTGFDVLDGAWVVGSDCMYWLVFAMGGFVAVQLNGSLEIGP